MKKALLLSWLFATIGSTGFAQVDSYWTPNSQSRSSIVTDESVARKSFPTTFELFNLNTSDLRQQLFRIVGRQSSGHSIIISLPNADGAIEQFEVVEASNFEPDLQEQFPEIRAFSGKGLTDKYATLKLSISPQGIQTMVFRTDGANEFIEPYSKDHKIYSVFRSKRDKGQLAWSCSTVEQEMAINLNARVSESLEAATGGSTGTLKTMRLAQSCNGEYANYFGATNSAQVGLVLAAFNATLTRCNGVYEKDLALHLNLIANTTAVIFYNPSTDPYGTQLSGWNLQLQQTLTSVIGNANYDIGHMFGASGGGGNAGCIGCVCVNPASSNSLAKGAGITSPADGIPTGDNFDIDYVAHEVGHQLGANHTFSMSNEGSGVNKEVGSGITIMGYAGITSQDVAPHSIDIFHQASIAQIQANLATKSCPITTNITATNATPVLALVGNYTIPISTPFALTAVATDANGDPLTYCWEQNDNSTTTGAGSVASPTKATGPNWLSFPAVSSGTRTFPRLSTVLAGLNVTGPLQGGDAGANTEALSSVGRTLNFRVTVRDNRAYSSSAPVAVGQTAFADAVVTVTNTSGPFIVTTPNTNVNWAGGSVQNITWNVANTTATPVSCANVKISLSTDGGLTFPTVLRESTPNDGSEALEIPNTGSTAARIKVESVGNIFFDISNTNFTIGAAVVCGNATGLTTTNIADNSATISWTAVTNASSYAVEYKPTSASTWTSFAAAQTATTADLTGLAASTSYDWRVSATCSAGAGSFVTAQFTTTGPCTAPATLSATAISSNSATVNWSSVSGAVSYDVDYKNSATTTWTNAVSGTTGTSRSIAGLSASTVYDFRVRTNCAGAVTSGYTTSQFTTATAIVCPGVYDVSTNGNTAGAATIPANTDVFGLLSPTGDNDYYKFIINSTGSITVSLTNLPANYHLSLLNSAGTVLQSSSNGGTNSETLTRNVTAGTYFARVYPQAKASNATNCYTLRVQLGTASRDVLFTQAASKMTVSPNPAGYVANLVFNTATTGQAEVTITNQLGSIVYRKAMAVQAGMNNRQLDVAKLQSGVYYVKLQNGTDIQTTRIVITK